MSLPIINDFPEYKITLPCTNQVLKFRPFKAKEQIDMLLIKDTEDVDLIFETVRQTLERCVTNNVDIGKLPLADFEYFMMKIREKSVGEEETIRFNCEYVNGTKIIENKDENGNVVSTEEVPDVCNGKTDVKVNFGDIKLSGPVPESIVKITDTVAVQLRGLAFDVAKYFNNAEDKMNETLVEMVSTIIEKIWFNEEEYDADNYSKEELVKWVENLTTEQFSKITDFIIKYPKLILDVKFKCSKCGREHVYQIRNLSNFFG